MRVILMTSLLAAGMILTGCQTEGTDSGGASTASGSTNQTEVLTSRGWGETQTTPTQREREERGDAQERNGGGTVNDDNVPPRVDNGGGSVDDGDDTPIPTSTAKEPDGWYMRTVVTAVTPEGERYVHNSAGVMGELKESSDERDKHDIPAFGKATLYVVFPKIKEEGALQDYFSDYKHYDPADQYDAERQVWTFQVKNEAGEDLSNATIKLEIQGPYKVYKKKESIGYEEVAVNDDEMLRHLSLVDLDNHKVYAYSELEDATLSMEGKRVRTFRWVLGGILSEHLNGSKVQKLAAQSLEKTAESQKDSLQAMSVSRGGKFGLPPSP